MSETTETVKPKKKGGLKKIALLVAGVAILGGGGAVAGMYISGAGLGGKSAEHDDPNKPKLVLKSDAVMPKDGAKAGADSKFQASYYEIEKSFTANLLDTEGFMQASIGVSTNYDNRVIENLKKHELAVRSAVLLTLSDQDGEMMATPDGKKKLLGLLKNAINKVLEDKEGFGGISDVYFTSFVVQ